MAIESNCPPFWQAFNNTVEINLCPESSPYFMSSMLGTYVRVDWDDGGYELPEPIFGSGIEVVAGGWIDGALVSSEQPHVVDGVQLPAPFMRSIGGTLSFEFSETYIVPPATIYYLSGYETALITGPGGSDPNQTVIIDVYYNKSQLPLYSELIGVPAVMSPTIIETPEQNPREIRGREVTLKAREPGYEFVVGRVWTFAPE